MAVHLAIWKNNVNFFIEIQDGLHKMPFLHLNSKAAPIEMEILAASKFESMDEFNILIPIEKRKEIAVHAWRPCFKEYQKLTGIKDRLATIELNDE